MVKITNAAESNRASLKYIREASWGTTPTSGDVKELRFTKSALEASKDTKVSEEIRADRMVPSIIEVAASSGGDIDGEFSAGSYDDFMEAFLLSYFSTPVNFFQVKGTAVTVTDTDEVTLVGGDYTKYITVGQYIKLEGFTDLDNNGYFEVATKTFTGGNTVVTVTATSLVAEGGTAFTKFLDAGDVVLADTGVTFTSGNTVDGGGANAFGDLRVGQKVYLDGLGKETGTFQFAVTDPPEGSYVTIDDGVNDPIVFEFRTNLALVAEGHYGVALSGTPATQAASLAAAINLNFRDESFDCSATVSTDTVTVTNHNLSGGSLAASDSGSSVTVTNFSGGSASKGGFFTVASVPDSDTFTTVETLSTDANSGGLEVVVKGSHVRNETSPADIVKQSFTIETGFTDISKYFVMNGMRLGTFEMSVDSGNIVGIKLNFMGSETIRSNTETLTGGSYVEKEAPATDVLNATANVGQILKDGSALTSAIMKLDFKGDGALREQRAIGEKFPAGIGYGRLSITGSFEAYFDSFELYDTFINHETTALAFDFEDVDHNKYYFNFPSLKVASDKIVPDGIDKDVMDQSDFTVQRDGVLKTMMMVDRFSSIRPKTAA